MNKKSLFAKLFIILVILAAGVVVSLVLIWTGPETVPEEKASSAKIVQTLSLVPHTRSVAVSAFGSVIPSRKVVIKPQVSGQVIRQSESITIGGHVREGDELIRIDPKDYELALSEVRSNLEQARFEREVESGRQVIAEREWNEIRAELDMEEVNRSLVLREPHLRRAEALMKKATNDIEIAQLQLSRTVIQAPFNAMVIEETVEVGRPAENFGISTCMVDGRIVAMHSEVDPRAFSYGDRLPVDVDKVLPELIGGYAHSGVVFHTVQVVEVEALVDVPPRPSLVVHRVLRCPQ